MIRDTPAVRMLNEVVRYGGLLVKRGAMYQDLEAQKVKGPAWMQYGSLPALDEEPEYTFDAKTGDFHRIGDPADVVAPAAPTYGDFDSPDTVDLKAAEPVDAVAPAELRCCPLHGFPKDGDPDHWWLKPGMSPETAEAICLDVNGDGQPGWRKREGFASRMFKFNKSYCGKSLRAALKPQKDEVPSEHFRFAFHRAPENIFDPKLQKRTANVCALLGKMNVDPDALTFAAEEETT